MTAFWPFPHIIELWRSISPPLRGGSPGQRPGLMEPMQCHWPLEAERNPPVIRQWVGCARIGPRRADCHDGIILIFRCGTFSKSRVLPLTSVASCEIAMDAIRRSFVAGRPFRLLSLSKIASAFSS